MKRRSTFIFSCLCFGYAFLYVPILAMIAWSFNDSRLMSVWTGFSLRWYQALWQNEQIIDAALLSLRIAVVSATFATLLGTLAALAMTRLGRFSGRTVFSGMLAAPLVMPEVITGLSLLMLFVSLQDLLGWPAKRGADTIAIAHITFAMAYVAVVVQARLTAMGRSLEEAAMDLGGRPMGVTLDITLPLIAPAMLSGWLLAFTLSLDDLVIASFVSGPESSTLPMVIYSKVRLGISPDVNALAAVIVGIVGLGRIGARLADLLAPWRARLVACDPHVEEARFVRHDVRRVGLETLLREADAVTIHCNLSAETEGLIGAREFGLMKPGAVLVNTARGPIVDAGALFDALEGGGIAGAALDVLPEEPPDPQTPLLGLGDKLILSPHMVSANRGTGLRMAVPWVERAVFAALRGEVPEHVVNPDALPRWRERFGGRNLLQPPTERTAR